MKTNNNQIIRIETPVERNLQRLLRESEIDPYGTIKESEPILTIDNISYGTRMNFSVLIGQPKSRKTFLAALIIAGCLDENNRIKRFSSGVIKTNILHFDTEQSPNHVLTTSKRVVALLNRKDRIRNYKIYSFRRHDVKTRMQLIKESIYTTENVSVVIIDGIADLVTSYNDEEQASIISQKLMKWTEERNIHIIVIIHQNKADNNAKGHLGSYLIQKAETVLSVTKGSKGSISTVKPVFSRNIDIDSFSFKIDDEGLPVLVDKVISITVDDKVNKLPEDFDDYTKNSIIKEVFLKEKEISRKELLKSIQLNLKQRGFDVGQNKCRDWLKFFKEENLIYQEKGKGPYKLSNG